jgi:hypothetical protein
MVELSLLLAGVFALPWYVLGILVIVFLCDIGAASKDEFAFATGAIIVGLLLVSGLGWWTEGFNPLGWAWNHPVDVITGFAAYTLIGCLWSVAKWKLFLRKTFKRSEKSFEERLARYTDDVARGNVHSGNEPKRTRPSESFASNNAGRLTGWIFHWPFSVLGVVIGDIIIRFADTCYKALHGLFERMARAQFAGYEEE